MTCECGKPVFVRKTSECKTCYHRRYAREHRRPRASSNGQARVVSAPGEKLGATIETATACSYSAAHDRVRAVRGLPYDHACADCGDPAKEWALRDGSPLEMSGTRSRSGRAPSIGRWSPYVWDYDPLCLKCHDLRDMDSFVESGRKSKGRQLVPRRTIPEVCPNGHALSADTIVERRGGPWVCRACANQRKRDWRIAKAGTCNCGQRVVYRKTAECKDCHAKRRAETKCACGSAAWNIKTAECKPCYYRRYRTAARDKAALITREQS